MSAWAMPITAAMESFGSGAALDVGVAIAAIQAELDDD
jgi:hypothetical protein